MFLGQCSFNWTAYSRSVWGIPYTAFGTETQKANSGWCCMSCSEQGVLQCQRTFKLPVQRVLILQFMEICSWYRPSSMGWKVKWTNSLLQNNFSCIWVNVRSVAEAVMEDCYDILLEDSDAQLFWSSLPSDAIFTLSSYRFSLPWLHYYHTKVINSCFIATKHKVKLKKNKPFLTMQHLRWGVVLHLVIRNKMLKQWVY